MLGSNFAGLAYDARQAADSSFHRDRFSGLPPYPSVGDPGDDQAAINAIVAEVIDLSEAVMAALRAEGASPTG